ncbi:transcriptional regulator, Crp/Fnr family [Sulfuricurvum kujiense DSM 16994]|uniref:Transcriptional regulator, Crp/Fnr family n=1 Tax=Sulfuricurvum kujiense (strain ATCC BAA-921 / DSM 16994 / JCM 11577 / YK-1) TaxID=709032 RepID=E4U1B4_SULKY|nr:Crp/Fnr family transcriptional regulator [Sulfuricurvum kujiense]ADR34451.1 transcriptional regulator, Crp/Fnr family [Sulfuricurvum kujiense DSM 16994]
MELDHYRFFQSLEPESLEKVRSEAKKVSLGVGTFLYYQGDVNQGILFLTKGCVKVFLHAEDIGKGEITLYYITPGEQCLVNTLSTVSQTPATATAIVDESIEGWLVPAETIRWLIDNSPAYRNFKISFCAERLSQIMHLVEELRFKRMDQRLLNWLFVQGRDTILTTHEQIAQILGTSREVISRILKNLEKEGIISLGRGSIKIIEPI